MDHAPWRGAAQERQEGSRSSSSLRPINAKGDGFSRHSQALTRLSTPFRMGYLSIGSGNQRFIDNAQQRGLYV
jgi:hypothetical protein